MNGFALQPGLFLGVRQGTGWPLAKIKKRERFLDLYSEIPFWAGPVGPVGAAGCAGWTSQCLLDTFLARSGTKTVPVFIFFSRWPSQLSGQNPDQNRFPFPFFIFYFFRGGEGGRGPRGRAQGGTHPHRRFGALKSGLLYGNYV